MGYFFIFFPAFPSCEQLTDWLASNLRHLWKISELVLVLIYDYFWRIQVFRFDSLRRVILVMGMRHINPSYGQAKHNNNQG